jgi:predicted GIY-YIG superfamily endonuclease
MVLIYILELKSGKYYVGKTRNLKFRLDAHFNYGGSAWTSKYRPVKLLKTHIGDDFDEDKYTIQTMKKYGIDNVRGGSFCQITLPDTSISTIKKMISGGTDKCHRCGRSGHFIADCYTKTDAKGKTLPDTDSESEDDYELWYACIYCTYECTSESKINKHEKKCKKEQKCGRCKRSGHNKTNCYAKTSIHGYRF